MTSDKEVMELALGYARQSLTAGCAPIGAILTNSNGNVVGWGRSTIVPVGDGKKTRVSVSHVELALIQREAEADRLHPDNAPYTLHVTLEPCHMCMGAAIVARIDRVIWCLDDFWGGATSMYNMSKEYMKMRLPDLVRTPYPDLQRQAADMWVEHLDQYGLPEYAERMLRWQTRVEV